MRVTLTKIAAFALLFWILHPSLVQAQNEPLRQAQGEPRFEYQPEIFSFTQSASFLSWELRSGGQTQKIQQAYLPAALSFPVLRQTTLTLGTAGGFSRAEQIRPGAREFNGVSDVRMRLSQSFGSSRWFAGAGVNLPAGKNRLNAEENAVVDALNENVLGFPLQRYGAGFDVELSLARAINLDNQLGLGLGATVVFPGAFEFREESQIEYQPGKRYVMTIMLNRIVPVLTWRVSLLGQYFAFDRLGGQQFFRQGWQLEPGASLEWSFARDWRTQLTITHIRKQENEFFSDAASPGDSARTGPPQHFYIDNSVHAKLALQRSFNASTQAGLFLDFNHFGESNVQQLNRAKIGRLGAQLVTKLSESIMLGATADYAAGSAANAQNGNVDLRGYGLGLWLKTQF